MQNKSILFVILALIFVGGGAVVLSSPGGSTDPSKKPSLFSFLNIFAPGGDSSRLTADTFTPNFPGMENKKSSAGTQMVSAVIEYNPEDETIFQHSIKKVKGDTLFYQRTKPVITPGTFVYKMSLISKEGILVQQGWDALPLEVIQTSRGTYLFHVVSFYSPGGSLLISSADNTPLWVGEIPEK